MNPGVQPIDSILPELLVRRLTQEGWRVYEIPGGAVDVAGFIRAASTAIPIDPPLVGMASWDAFSDSAWGGLEGAGDAKVAVVWADASRLKRESPADFRLALDVLVDLVELLADGAATGGGRVSLSVWVDVDIAAARDG